VISQPEPQSLSLVLISDSSEGWRSLQWRDQYHANCNIGPLAFLKRMPQDFLENPVPESNIDSLITQSNKIKK
jgi:hypothetical protein